jgi:PAS domain S-box-containing protein
MAVDAIFLHEVGRDPGHGKFIDANPTACKILGYRREELLEMCPVDIIGEESQHTIGTMRQELERDRFSLREIVIRTRTGARIIFETMMHLFELGRRRSS